MSTPATPFHKRPLWIAIAAFLALILVVGGISAATGAFSGGGTTAAPPTGDAAVEPQAAPSPSASALPDGAASACGLSGYETTSSLTQAPQARWEVIGSTAVPQDPQGEGPGKSEDDGRFTTCFAHTAAGALFASINYLGVTSDTRNFSRVYELLADGDAKDMARTPPSPSHASGSRAQIAGFKVDRYSPDEATIDLALTYADTGAQLVSFPFVVRWEHGDWKVVFTKDGPPMKPSALTSLGGYIPFSGV